VFIVAMTLNIGCFAATGLFQATGRRESVGVRRAFETMAMNSAGRAFGAVSMTLVAGCAVDTPPGALIADPYENINRPIHSFNVAADRFVLRPVAQGYDFVTPALFQHMIGNFVDHIMLPVVFFNNILQGDVEEALATVGRFGVNTIVGAGGLLDPATEFGLPYDPTDFGLTLASHDANEGPFIMLPIFGPSTGRDAVGRLVDFGLNPLTYVTVGGGNGATAATVARFTVPPVVARNENFEIVDQILYESEDSYVTLRAAYVQARRAQTTGGAVDVENLPDIFAE
jgi:phospholipid-binding lipoprotein MlaA